VGLRIGAAIKTGSRAAGVAHVVEHLPNENKVLSSNSSATHTHKKIKKTKPKLAKAKSFSFLAGTVSSHAPHTLIEMVSIQHKS
jgi:hypothetical protein